MLQAITDRADRARLPLLGRARALGRTIRGKLLIWFSAMGLCAGLFGLVAAVATYQAGRIVHRDSERSFIAIRSIHAALEDALRLREERTREASGAGQAGADDRINHLQDAILADLTQATSITGSEQAHAALDRVRTSIAELNETGGTDPIIARRVRTETEQTLASLLQGLQLQASSEAKNAEAAIDFQLTLILVGALIAALVPALGGWYLARRTVRPITEASAVAARLARGRFDEDIPEAGDDELGAMLSAMSTMRNNIRAAMDREVTLRRSAQTRLAEALEGSHDGIIVVDADLRIALANSQAANFLGVPNAVLAPGTPITQLTGVSRSSRKFLLELMGLEGRAEESRLSDGRWLRVSRSWTRDGGFIALCSDISTQKDQEAALKATNLRLDAALENMSQGLCLFGADQTLHVVNRRFCEIFGVRTDAVRPGMTLQGVIAVLAREGNFPGRKAEDVYEDEARVLASRSRAIRSSEIGGGRIIGIATETLTDGGWLITYEDVTERRQAEEQIAFMARHDALTGLPNRVLFAERIEEAIALSKRGRVSAVHCLDLDHFKNVNDTLGHPIGDSLLRIVAERLQNCVRSIDTVARLGGDEFAVVQCGIETPEEAVSLANRMVDRLSQPFEIEGHNMSVGVSIGISLAPEDGDNHGKLLKNADVALYRAKEDGRGTWRFFEAEMDSRLQARRELEMDLRKALEGNQFEIYYQPQFDLRLDRISGFEALVRWQHPMRGLIAPTEFIPIAEEIGLIRDLGAWVLRTACIETSRWPAPLRVAVNVSAAQLRNADFCTTVADALAVSGLEPNRLELEVTETVIFSNSVVARDLMHQIRALGVQLAMDDFGTGYSSLTSLRSFPFDKIKIDRSFVQDLCSNPSSEPVVRAVIVLGQGLGVRVTAEGVETAEQLARLRMESCSEVQGYLISPPRPASEIPQMLGRWNAGSRRGLVSAVA